MPKTPLYVYAGVALVLLCNALNAALAAEQKERLLYDVMFGGLHVADVVVSLDQTPAQYQSRLEMRTRGVLQWFQDFRADMKSEGAFVLHETNIRTVPTLYNREWRSPEIASDLIMQFDPRTGAGLANERLYNPATGADLKPENMPWNNRRSAVPPVPEELRAGSVDPITAFVAARRRMFETGEREVRMPIYDGRRRYDIISTLGRSKTATVRGQSRELTPVTSRLEPVFGFEPDSEDRMRESKGTTLFSNDARFVPVQIILGNDMFTSVMNLVAECNDDPAPCDNFGRTAPEQNAPAP